MSQEACLPNARFISEWIFILDSIVYVKQAKKSNTIYSWNAFLNLEIKVTMAIR